MIFKGPFRPKPFYDSVIFCWSGLCPCVFLFMASSFSYYLFLHWKGPRSDTLKEADTLLSYTLTSIYPSQNSSRKSFPTTFQLLQCCHSSAPTCRPLVPHVCFPDCVHLCTGTIVPEKVLRRPCFSAWLFIAAACWNSIYSVPFTLSTRTIHSILCPFWKVMPDAITTYSQWDIQLSRPARVPAPWVKMATVGS